MTTARELVARHVFDGMTIAVGGFGLCGNPFDLIEAVRDSGVTDLTIVSNNMGTDGKGLGVLLEGRQVRKVVASYVGENRRFAQQYLDGQLEIEFTPQGTLAERLRAGGAGIPAFYTPTGAHTIVAEGKPTTQMGGRTVILEHAIVADLALVRAHHADTAGNLTYRMTARNFNPVVATAGRVTLAEVDRVVEGYLDPDLVQTPGIYIDEVVVASARAPEIEQRTTRPRQSEGGAHVEA
ncbi:CoA transferase subunit A [Embleya sp. NPDC050493]|uniref:CoA transferase subunit A n=1 Tax=Embleya sp. NPDC050493 TaxID=3363989 RepID=UPI0037B0D9E6